MTLTIDLPPALEAKLNEAAEARGEDKNRFAVAALRAGVAALATEAEEEFDDDTLAGIGERLAQLDAGQGRPFAEFVAEVRTAQAHEN